MVELERQASFCWQPHDDGSVAFCHDQRSCIHLVVAINQLAFPTEFLQSLDSWPWFEVVSF